MMSCEAVELMEKGSGSIAHASLGGLLFKVGTQPRANYFYSSPVFLCLFFLSPPISQCFLKGG